MPIVCPHCGTTYNVDSAKLGTSRTVRCARCKEVWTAQPALELAIAGDVEWTDHVSPPEVASGAVAAAEMPQIDSPPLAAEMPAAEPGTELVTVAPHPVAPVAIIDASPASAPRERRTRSRSRREKERRATAPRSLKLPTSIAAMGALIAALVVWRGDVVRLMPQTAIFYKTIGLGVNLRGLSFRDVKLTNEDVDGKPVLVIEGAIVDDLAKPLEIPRLRFVVRNSKGVAIYAWNAMPEQAVIQPGERVAFRSRLAQPPEDAHSIDVRFFNKRDLVAGA